MTDIKFEILKAAYDDKNRHVRRSDLLNMNISTIMQAKYAISELIYSKCLKESIGSDYLTLTDKGAVDYELECESRQLKAEEDEQFKKTFRFNKNTTIISIVIAAIASIAAIVEAFFLFC